MSDLDKLMNYGNNQERLGDLKKVFHAIVPFVGAGLSVPFGFKQWDEFLLSCCDNETMKKSLENILNLKEMERYEKAASYLSKELEKIDPNLFKQKIENAFKKKALPVQGSTVDLLSSIFKGSIITTNFDHVLEDVTGYKHIFPHQKEDFAKFIKHVKTQVILKLHGDIDDIDHIILTHEQYKKSYFEDEEFQEKFNQLLTHNVLLFLGCSLNQDRTMQFMKRESSLRVTNTIKNYAFISSPAFRLQDTKIDIPEEAKKEEQEIEKRLMDVNILPIWYPEGEHQWINTYLKWLSIERDYWKVFQNIFETPLFLEEDYEEEEKIKLKSIYVVPDFVFIDKNNNAEKTESCLLDFIYDFMNNSSADIIKKYQKINNSSKSINTIIILGEPGIGKSSLISKIVVDNINNKDKFYCLRLRDLDKKEIQTEGALNAILNLLSIEDIDLTQKTLILDGVDELCGIENYETSINRFCEDLIEQANELNFKLLFTSRLNYIYLDAFFDNALVLKLLPFQKKQFELWFENYQIHRKGTESLLSLKDNILALCKINNEETKRKLELFGIPLVLYLLAELKITTLNISSFGQLYDQLFQKLETKFYDKATHTIPDLYKNCKDIATSIATEMFHKNKDILNAEEYRGVAQSLPQELQQSLNIIPGYEQYYLLSFYYRTTNSEKRSVEFIHKSLMEYLVGEKFYNLIAKVLKPSDENFLDENKQREQLKKRLDEFFTYSPITDEICTFFLYKVIKNEQRSQLFTLFKKYFGFYLENGFLFQINNNPLTKIENLFISYWKILRILSDSNKNNLLEDSEKSLFCNYITKLQLRNLNLSYQNLSYLRLNDSTLVRFDLSGANLKKANLTGTNLTGANLSGANLKKALLGADLSRADLTGADLTGADLTGANLFVAHLSRAVLSEADLSGAHLFGADLSGADLTGANLFRANLTGANLSEADLSGADLTGANLFVAHLSRADLSGADLSGANLSGANLSEADLSGADLSEAYLSGADLSEADLSGAHLSGAHLIGAHLSGAYFFKYHSFKFYFYMLYTTIISIIVTILLSLLF